MKTNNTDAIIREVAKKHNVTPEEVLKSIDEVITKGLESDDPKLRGLWQSMGDGKNRPDAGKVILLLASLAAVRLVFDSNCFGQQDTKS